MGLNTNSFFTWNGTAYCFAFNTSALEIKSYLVQILATGENLESHIIDVVFEIVPLSLKLEISESFITIQNDNIQSTNMLRFRIYDESHGQYRTDLTVTGAINGESFEFQEFSENYYILSLNRLNLSPSNEPYQLSLFIVNPYGNNATAQINLFVPIPVQTQDPYLIYISLLIAVISILTFSGYIYKKNYTDLTKFQRDIRNFKKIILNKQPIKVLPESTRNALLMVVLRQQYKN